MTCRNYIPGPNGDCQRCGEMRAGHAGTDWKGLYDGMSVLCEQQQKRAQKAEGELAALRERENPEKAAERIVAAVFKKYHAALVRELRKIRK